MRTLAIIPARGGSRRIPGKNLRKFCGRPLLSWTLDFALGYPSFDRVHLSTDSSDYAALANTHGLDVPFLRSEAASTDTAPTIDAVAECLDRFGAMGERFDVVAVLQPTTPFRLSCRWDEGFLMLQDETVECVASASPVHDHPWHVFTCDENHDVSFLFDASKRSARSQDLPPAYRLNGSLYLTKISAIERQGALVTPRCRAVIMDDPLENIDIDTMEEWSVGEDLMQQRLAM